MSSNIRLDPKIINILIDNFYILISNEIYNNNINITNININIYKRFNKDLYNMNRNYQI